MVTPRQLRTLLEVVGEANGATGLAELRRLLVSSVRRLVPADYCTYNEVGADGNVLAAIAEPAIPDAILAEWARLAAQNPLVQRYQRTRDGRPYRFSDVIGRAELESLELFRLVYAPLGVEHQIALALPGSPDVTVGLVLSRGGADFSDTERELLALLRPHLVQAFRNARLQDESLRPTADGLAALGLSPAEARVLAALAGGAGTVAVAHELQLSPRTVLKHGERIHRKLGVGDRAQAVAAAWTSTRSRAHPEVT